MTNFQHGETGIKGLTWLISKDFTGRAQINDGMTLSLVHKRSNKIVFAMRVAYGVHGELPQSEINKIMAIVKTHLGDIDWPQPIDVLLKQKDGISGKTEALYKAVTSGNFVKNLERKVIAEAKFYGILEEDAALMSVDSGNAGDMSDPVVRPPVVKKYRESQKCFGEEIFEVDTETFHKSIRGRKKFARYKKHMSLEDYEDIGQDIKEFARRNPKKAIILKDSRTGNMIYLKGGIHGNL